MDARTSTSDSASFGLNPSSGDVNNSATRLPGLAGTQSEKQLTQRELAALRTIKRNVDTTKYAGWLLGASGTWILLSRRKPPPRMIPKLGWCVVGGLGGSFLTMPAGILLSRNVLRDVEDPQHLRKVLAGAIEEQRQGRKPQVGVAPPKGLNGESDFEQAQQQAEWGGEQSAQNYTAGFDNENVAANTVTAHSTAQGSTSIRSGGNTSDRSGTPRPPADAAPDGTGPGTRWAQLRGERGVEPSKWERIRQDNARTAYSRSTAASSDAEQSNWQDLSSSYNNNSQSSSEQQQTDKRFSSSRTPPRSTDEPVMTLSGAEDDPRWSSPATFSPRSSGWGNNELLDDPAAQSQTRRGPGSTRSYGILSVLEETSSNTASEYQLESDAPIQVVKGSLLSALAGGTCGSIYGVLKGRQGAGTVLGTRMAFSTFCFAFPFFAVREYILSPILKRTSSGPDPANRHMRLSAVAKNRHTHNLIASGLAGAVVGAGAAGFTRGPAAIHKGALTFGLACTGLQLVGNQARIVRDTIIRRTPRPVSVPDSMSAHHVLSDPPAPAPPAPSASEDVQPEASTHDEAKQADQRDWLSKVKRAMPIRSVSDQDYEEKLKHRLANVNHRMADIEIEIREIEELLKQQQDKAGKQD